MELKINTIEKTITVIGEANASELFLELQKMLGTEFGNYKIGFQEINLAPYMPNSQPIIMPMPYVQPDHYYPTTMPWWEVFPITVCNDSIDYSKYKITYYNN